MISCVAFAQKEPDIKLRVTVTMTKDVFGAKEPVTATIAAVATGDLPGASEFDLRIGVDGGDEDTGVVLRVDPSRPAGDRAEIDLRRVPGLKLAAGEHVAVARITTRTTHEEHVSEPVKFRIEAEEGPDDKKDKGGGTPPPQKSPPPPPPPHGQGPGDAKKDPQQTPPAPPLPPVALDRKVVTPLFGEGDEVKKKGLVLVLDPGGGDAGAPVRKPLEDALPDAKRRAEAAVDRSRLRDDDKDLVRRYFDLLGRLRR